MAKIYWRRIKAGTRFFIDVPKEELKEEIRQIARMEVLNGELTPEEYFLYIGEIYEGV